jgi:hypothetical protein
MNTRTNISVRQLAYEIRVNKNTAWQMIKRIQIAILKERELLERLIKFDSQNHLE